MKFAMLAKLWHTVASTAAFRYNHNHNHQSHAAVLIASAHLANVRTLVAMMPDQSLGHTQHLLKSLIQLYEMPGLTS
jgi:hypothetical protein